jgi:hypothetical protein
VGVSFFSKKRNASTSNKIVIQSNLANEMLVYVDGFGYLLAIPPAKVDIVKQQENLVEPAESSNSRKWI